MDLSGTRSLRVFTRSGKAGSKYTQSAASIMSYLYGIDGGSGSPLASKRERKNWEKGEVTPARTKPKKDKKERSTS